MWLWRFVLSFALLNALWTFENRWPGFGVHAMPRLSFELCLGVVALMGWVAWRGRLTGGAATVWAMGFVALMVVRYANVTAPAVLGRPVNVYWDGRHAVELLQLATQSLSTWQVLGIALGVALAAMALLVVVRHAIRVLAQCVVHRRPRPWLAALVAAISPVRVSEHLSWGSIGGRYFNDLLPMPYTLEALSHMSDKVDRVQQALGRQLLIENPSSYLQLPGEMGEAAFLAELARRSGCGILLDLNNLHVSSVNHGLDCADYLAAIDLETVGEIHLAGFTDKALPQGHLYIDTHSTPVAPPVWALYRQLCQQRAIPTLIEWDLEIPPLPVLLGEAQLASEILSAAQQTSREAAHV